MRNALLKAGMLCLPLALCAAAPSYAEEAAARLGQTDVTAGEVRGFVATLAPAEQAAVNRDPALMAQAVRLMLINRMVLNDALAKKWDAEPSVQTRLAKARENVIVESYLQSIPAGGAASEAEIQAAYDANRPAMIVPRQFELAQIFVSQPKGADAAVEAAAAKKLADVQRKLKAPGADFAAIAKTDSDSKETAGKGGEIGWVPEPMIKPEILTPIMGLAKGGIAEPVRMDDGWMILKLIDVKQPGQRPLAEVHDAIAAQIATQRAAQARRVYLAKLQEENPIAINEMALSKLVQTPARAEITAVSTPTAATAPAPAQAQARAPAAAKSAAPRPAAAPRP
jgi:parvulin-like peptidyl-prolyl isomerase